MLPYWIGLLQLLPPLVSMRSATFCGCWRGRALAAAAEVAGRTTSFLANTRDSRSCRFFVWKAFGLVSQRAHLPLPVIHLRNALPRMFRLRLARRTVFICFFRAPALSECFPPHLFPLCVSRFRVSHLRACQCVFFSSLNFAARTE